MILSLYLSGGPSVCLQMSLFDTIVNECIVGLGFIPSRFLHPLRFPDPEEDQLNTFVEVGGSLGGSSRRRGQLSEVIYFSAELRLICIIFTLNYIPWHPPWRAV